jgi:hypothetical protein
MPQIIVDGTTYDLPPEDDWELMEIAQIAKLTREFGDVGSTIGAVWLVRHRVDPSFTVEDAGKIKLAQFEDPEVSAPDPLPVSGPQENGIASASRSSSSAPEDVRPGNHGTVGSTT